MRTPISRQIVEFEDDQGAGTHARHYSRYVHRDFIVWLSPAGRWTCGPANADTLERVVQEVTEDEPAFSYHEGCSSLLVSRDIAEIMLANCRVGVTY